MRAAFTAFYENRDGIRDAFAATWRRLAAEFAGDTAVAGFDLFNEPNIVFDAIDERAPLHRAGVVGHRTGPGRRSRRRAVFPHIIFLEPIVVFPLAGTMPAPEFTTDTQIAFAPHNYAEVIGAKILTVEQTFDAAAAGRSLAELAALDRRARRVRHRRGDARGRERASPPRRTTTSPAARSGSGASGAATRTRSACPGRSRGDGRAAQRRRLPDDVDAGPNVDLMKVASRAYPRAVPGRPHRAPFRSRRTRVPPRRHRRRRSRRRPATSLLWFPGDERPGPDRSRASARSS